MLQSQYIVVWASSALPLVALVLLCIAAYTDIRRRRIANWVSIWLVLLFCLIAVMGVHPLDFGSHLIWGGLTLLTLLPFFAAGKIGGGDVKFLSAVTLWNGPLAGLEFLMLTGLIGGGFALLIMSPLTKFLLEWGLAKTRLSESFLIVPTQDSLPYGVPISLAGSFTITSIFFL